MNVKCMYCKIDELGAELSDEHIIPEVLGGIFRIPVVCKKHNEKFGDSLESDLKKNGFIATALDKLRIQPPNQAYRHGAIWGFPVRPRNPGVQRLWDEGASVAVRGSAYSYRRASIGSISAAFIAG